MDTAFYECRATNGIDTISSVAIITVELNKGGFKSRKNNAGFVNSGNSGDYDDIGLLPETYSEPDFNGMGAGGPSFEGGQKPTNFGSSSRFDQRQHQDNSQKSPNNNQNDLKRLGETIPNLKPNERSGIFIFLRSST